MGSLVGLLSDLSNFPSHTGSVDRIGWSFPTVGDWIGSTGNFFAEFAASIFSCQPSSIFDPIRPASVRGWLWSFSDRSFSGTSITSWSLSTLVVFTPFSTSADSTLTSCCQVPHGDPRLSSVGSLQGLVDGVAGSQFPGMPICLCHSTPVTDGIFGLPSGTRQGSSLFINGRCSDFGLATTPRVSTKLLSIVVAYLHLHEYLMYPYNYSFFHAQPCGGPHSQPQSQLSFQALLCHEPAEFGPRYFWGAAPSRVSEPRWKLGGTPGWGLVFPIPGPDRDSCACSSWVVGSHPGLTSQRLWQVTRLFVSCHGLVPLCMFCLHPLSILLRYNFNMMRMGRPSKLISLVVSSFLVSSGILGSLRTCVLGVPLQPPPPTHILTTDASTYGLGVVWGSLWTCQCCCQGMAVFSLR